MRVKITHDEINLLGEFIKKKCGIVLDEKKDYLFESRLSPLLKELGCEDYIALYNLVIRDATGKMATKLIDAVCTNETSFFRDQSPFDLLAHKLIPDYYEKHPGGTLRLLSAACSTGQELYSIVMMLMDAGITPPRFRFKFVGVDISDTAFAKASRGEYTKFELARGMKKEKLSKYFHETSPNTWRINDDVRSLVMFKKANLLNEAEFRMLGRFDIILCRNVAIYFSIVDKTSLFNSIWQSLEPDGSLIIGSTESLFGISSDFVRKTFHNAVYYQKE